MDVGGIVAPTVVAREFGKWHQFDGVDAKVGEIIQFCDGIGELGRTA
jgi:hypothetical protein